MARRGTSILRNIRRALTALVRPTASAGSAARSRGSARLVEDEPGHFGDSATVGIDPPAAGALHITYTPAIDGDPDAGEVVWTWVPYDEQDGRGKDRPVLIIGRYDDDRVYAVRLTSKSHEDDRQFLAIGAGPWDSRGRPSWVDTEQIYSVHWRGMRREASTLDLGRFVRVADALHRRYGWAVGE